VPWCRLNGTDSLSHYLSVCLSVYLSVFLLVCLITVNCRIDARIQEQCLLPVLQVSLLLGGTASQHLISAFLSRIIDESIYLYMFVRDYLLQ